MENPYQSPQQIDSGLPELPNGRGERRPFSDAVLRSCIGAIGFSFLLIAAGFVVGFFIYQGRHDRMTAAVIYSLFTGAAIIGPGATCVGWLTLFLHREPRRPDRLSDSLPLGFLAGFLALVLMPAIAG
ncbi:hypothetical protein Pla123a_36170 [Posidoniimonas polymericola]|uniref:Uncharacterized protein n=1 Tax=Posidoniimonas polymericola TaxID=2528002 RepID=A0A5C5YF76_9BACT|nr:hypothetical protein [Posidoniimonas polymericola]TWT73724.1 hypothetical protein Pla123a_36170 [Posidoniimonas polymericola]